MRRGEAKSRKKWKKWRSYQGKEQSIKGKRGITEKKRTSKDHGGENPADGERLTLTVNQ